MDVLTASLYFLLSIYVYMNFKGIIKFTPLLYILVYFFMSISGMTFFENGLFPGKSDQYMYIAYGEEVASNVKSMNIIDHIRYALKFCPYPVIGYWCIVGYYFDTALISPVEGLRLLNLSFALIGILYLKKTVEVLFCDHKKEKIMLLLFSLSPSVMMFNFYVVRDSIMLYLFIIFVYYLVKIYLEINGDIEYIKMIILIGIIFNFREQLSLVIVMMLIFIKLGKFLKGGSMCLLLTYNFLWMLILYIVGALSDKPILTSIALWVLNIDTWVYSIPKFFLYTGGFGFLAAEEDFAVRIIQRVLAFDSILIPFLFTTSFILRKQKKHEKFQIALMSSYILYFLIYMYAEMVFRGNYGFHFRAMLPFYYIFMLFMLLNFKERKIN